MNAVHQRSVKFLLNLGFSSQFSVPSFQFPVSSSGREILNWKPEPLCRQNRHMKSDHDRSLRQHLIELLKGGSAHAQFDEVIDGIPAKLRGRKPAGMPHSPLMLLEHMRI